MMKWSLVIGLSFVTIGLRHSAAEPRVELHNLNSEQSSIVELGPTLSPFQHVRFCQRFPADCQPNSNVNELIDLNSKSLGLLERINRQVNAAIVPERKDHDGSVDNFWAVAPKKGDCNDYAVTKQHELRQRGFSSGALRLSVVETADGDGHLVLVVATTKGDLILDNLTNEIHPIKEANYRWLKIQSKSDPNYWVGVKSPVFVSAMLKEVFRKMAMEARSDAVSRDKPIP